MLQETIDSCRAVWVLARLGCSNLMSSWLLRTGLSRLCIGQTSEPLSSWTSRRPKGARKVVVRPQGRRVPARLLGATTSSSPPTLSSSPTSSPSSTRSSGAHNLVGCPQPRHRLRGRRAPTTSLSPPTSSSPLTSSSSTNSPCYGPSRMGVTVVGVAAGTIM